MANKTHKNNAIQNKTDQPATIPQNQEPATVTVTPTNDNSTNQNIKPEAKIDKKMQDLRKLKALLYEEERKLDKKFMRQKRFLRKLKKTKRNKRRLKKQNSARQLLLAKTTKFSEDLTHNFRKLMANFYDWKKILTNMGNQELMQKDNLVDIF